MNGSELLLPFVIADQRRRMDEAVLVRLAREARNGDSGNGFSVSGLAGRIHRQLRTVADRGQLGPVARTASIG